MPISVGHLTTPRRVRAGVLVLTLVAALVLSAMPAFAGDATLTRKARTSQQHRATIDLNTWQDSRHGKKISWRESNNRCRAVSADGDHRGKWQMSRPLWRDYGGRKFARTADRATCLEQDRVARRVWVDQWWWPWGG